MIINSDNTPRTEYSEEFIQGMINRMGMSFIKYGKIKDAYPNDVNAMTSMELRLKKYKETGNKEYLIDAANFLMIEFIHPAHENAHFISEDSNKSPGRIWRHERNPTVKPNEK